MRARYLYDFFPLPITELDSLIWYVWTNDH